MTGECLSSAECGEIHPGSTLKGTGNETSFAGSGLGLVFWGFLLRFLFVCLWFFGVFYYFGLIWVFLLLLAGLCCCCCCFSLPGKIHGVKRGFHTEAIILWTFIPLPVLVLVKSHPI